jgi:hypothetical protein
MESDTKSRVTATPEKLADDLGWAVRLSWPGERSDTAVGFSEGGSAAWISQTEALREVISGSARARSDSVA